MTLPLLARGGCRPQLARQTLLRSLRAALCHTSFSAFLAMLARIDAVACRTAMWPHPGP